MSDFQYFIRKWKRPSRFSNGAAAFAIAVLLPALLSGTALRAQGLSEYQVKAAFLLNFTKFVEWPARTFESPVSPLNICIFGQDPFGSDLDQLVSGETFGSRRIAVVRAPRTPVPHACHVLFISKTEKDVARVLADAGPGVLTVSDRAGFLEDGGMIALVIEDRHVRFDVNQSAALKASLMLNVRMLAVARSVRR